jgi:N-acetylmuramoyl-L-alanine amidase
VFVDAGHGGPDPGASGTTAAGVTVLEKDSALATARALRDVLRRQGYRVVLSRVEDTSVAQLSPDDISTGTLTVAGEHHDVAARIACANAARAGILVSLHLNAFDDPTVGGAETYFDSARPFRAANQRLATLVQAGILASLRAAGWTIDDRGTMDDTLSGTPAATTEAAAYGHLLELGPAAPGWLDRPSAMPGVLCEPLFVTNPGEAEIAATPAGQQAIARGPARAIDAFFAP